MDNSKILAEFDSIYDNPSLSSKVERASMKQFLLTSLDSAYVEVKKDALKDSFDGQTHSYCECKVPRIMANLIIPKCGICGGYIKGEPVEFMGGAGAIVTP